MVFCGVIYLSPSEMEWKSNMSSESLLQLYIYIQYTHKQELNQQPVGILVSVWQIYADINNDIHQIKMVQLEKKKKTAFL